MRHEFPIVGAQAEGKSTPHSQIAYTIGLPVAAMAADMLEKRADGDVGGVKSVLGYPAEASE
jgi:hypothetical protein